jgi:hypothetical protein
MKEICTYFLSKLYNFQTKEYLYITLDFQVVSLLLSFNENDTVAYLNEVTKDEDIEILCRMFESVQFLGGQDAYRKALVDIIDRFKNSQHAALISRRVGYGIEQIDNRNKAFNS